MVAHQVFRTIFALVPALWPTWSTSGVIPNLTPEPSPPARSVLPRPPPRAGSQTEELSGCLPSPLNNLAPHRHLSLLHSLKRLTSKRTPRPPPSSFDRLTPLLSRPYKRHLHLAVLHHIALPCSTSLLRAPSKLSMQRSHCILGL
jgi:hypothetical protein